MSSIQKEMIEKFQCPGCISGSNTTCGSCKCEEIDNIFFNCAAHYPGTREIGIGQLYLGLPKGFNKVGPIYFSEIDIRKNNIRLFSNASNILSYDNLNIPVWAMEEDGYLFVRVFLPRRGETYVDIIKGGKREKICPQALNVADFIDEID